MTVRLNEPLKENFLGIDFCQTNQNSGNLRKCKARKFYIRRNNNKIDFIEIVRIVIVDLLRWNDLMNDNEILLSLLR